MNIICGINPVMEALSSGTRHFDRLLVAKGLRNRRVSEAMRLASQRGVPLRFETRETLDRMAGEVPHQGLVGVVSAKPVMSLEALLEQTRATWAPSCARPRPREPPVCCCPSGTRPGSRRPWPAHRPGGWST
jgi:tRNA G18 (ribose-2'-O)-methylase SpoU